MILLYSLVIKYSFSFSVTSTSKKAARRAASVKARPLAERLLAKRRRGEEERREEFERDCYGEEDSGEEPSKVVEPSLNRDDPSKKRKTVDSKAIKIAL